MNDKLKQIEHKLEELTAKLELIEKRQQHQQTLYQHLFGQPPLQTDPKLDSVTTQIADFKKDKGRLYDILQVSYIIIIRQLLLSHSQNQKKTGQKLLFIQKH
jgi:hypothetical protein